MNLSSEFSLTASFGGLLFPRSLRTSPIDELLSKPDIHLEELLEDEDFSFELKNGNPKLLDYLTRSRENIRKLIDYITKLAPDESDQNRAYKFPFRACEIFESDISTIMNSFFGFHRSSTQEFSDSFEKTPEEQSIDPPKEQTPEGNVAPDQNGLLDYAFAFLESEDVKNCVLNGYFSKLVQLLFKRNAPALLEYVYSNPSYLLLMAQNLQERSICELLLLFLCYEPSQLDSKKLNTTFIKNEVINIVIDRMNKDRGDPDVLLNGSSLIQDIIMKCNSISDGKEMTQNFFSQHFIQLVLSYIKPEDNLNICNACNILYSIICVYTPQGLIPGIVENEDPTYDEAVLSQDLVFQSYLECLEIFSNILKKVSEAQEINTTYGAQIKPLGTGRLRIMEVFERLLKIKSDTLYQKISELDLINTITTIFVNSMWNNMLHYIYERLVNSILENAHPILLTDLFEKAKLVEVILNISQEEEVPIPGSKRTTRKGYLGHVVRIANELTRHSNINDTVKDYVMKNPQWETYVSTSLKKRNEINNTEIGGPNPRNYLNMGIESGFATLAMGEGVMHYSARDQEQGFSNGPSQERAFGNVAEPLEIVTNSPERGSVGPDSDYDYEIQKAAVKVTSPKRPNLPDLFTVSKEELKHHAVMVAEKIVPDSPDPMAETDINSNSPEMPRSEEKPKEQAPEIQPYTLSANKRTEASPKVEQFDASAPTNDPNVQSTSEPAEENKSEISDFTLGNSTAPSEQPETSPQKTNPDPEPKVEDRESNVPSRESEDILTQVADELVPSNNQELISQALSPPKKSEELQVEASKDHKSTYGDASPEEIRAFEDFRKQSPLSDFEAWKREMREKQNQVIKPFTLSQSRNDKTLGLFESKIADPFASISDSIQTVLVKKPEPKASDQALPTDKPQPLQPKFDLVKSSSLHPIEETKASSGPAEYNSPEHKPKPTQEPKEIEFKSADIKQVDLKPTTFHFYNEQPEESIPEQPKLVEQQVVNTVENIIPEPQVTVPVAVPITTDVIKTDENKENALPPTTNESMTSSRVSEANSDPKPTSPEKMVTRRPIQSMAGSDLHNSSFSSVSSNLGKVKLILRVKKRENENHKQIINLITKLSKGEKIDLQSTPIEIIDPANPDLGSFSSRSDGRSAPSTSDLTKSMVEEPKIQLQPVGDNSLVTSDGK